VGSTSSTGFLLVFCVVTMALKCTVVELEAWERQTDIQTDGETDRSQHA